MESFLLWHPYLSQDGMTGGFDITPYEFSSFDLQSHEVMEQFLSEQGFLGQLSSWSIMPFRCSYYAPAYKPTWRERYVTAWEVSLVFADRAQISKPRKYHAYSSTVHGSHLEGNSCCHAMIIFDYINSEKQNVTAQIDEVLNTDGLNAAYRHIELGDWLRQVRINCGLVEFPAYIAKLESIESSIQNVALSTNWATTLRESEQQKELFKQKQFAAKIESLFGYKIRSQDTGSKSNV